jgi:hypothetical protein
VPQAVLSLDLQRMLGTIARSSILVVICPRRFHPLQLRRVVWHPVVHFHSCFSLFTPTSAARFGACQYLQPGKRATWQQPVMLLHFAPGSCA